MLTAGLCYRKSSEPARKAQRMKKPKKIRDTMDEIHSTPVEEITWEQVRRWQDELFTLSTNAKTDEEFEYCEQLSNALGRKLCESIDSLPPDEQDEVRRILPKEKWAADLADNIETARETGDLRSVRMGEKMLQEAFALNTITRH